MAEVRKKEVKDPYNTKKVNTTKKTTKKSTTKVAEKKETVAKKTKKVEEKKSLWIKIQLFFHGVKSEFLKVHWPSKENMIKYSIATIFFIIFCSAFFYLIDVIFALIQSLFH